jgi:sigma-B regulation protein RsbU (phosphoserine phosphatase)
MPNAPAGCLLLVDDDKVNRLLMGYYLTQQGHTVIYAENGRQALETLRTQPIEMMLLDIEMPEMNGYQVLEQVIADPNLRDIPVIVTSGLEEIESVVKCVEMGAEDYLTKPINQVLLRARINASLEKKRLRDQQTHLLLRLERELEIARQTQQSILPDHLPEREGYDFGARMIPARVVGGDFYEFISLDNEHLGVVIGDVTDKGLPAALFMALTYSLVSVDAMQTGSPVETIRNVNRHLLSMNAAGMFVTLLYGILDYRTGQFRYARAGHLVPIVIDSNGQTVKIPVNTGQPLGLFKDPLLDEQSITIPPGSMILMYSDGLNEASNPEGDEFGYQRLYETLSQHRQQPAQAICEQLWLAIQAHAGCTQPQDDFTTVVIKRFDSPV